MRSQTPLRAVQDGLPAVTVGSGGAVSVVSGAVPQAEDGGKRKKKVFLWDIKILLSNRTLTI